MTERIALIHATSVAIAPIEDAFASLWPEAQRMNLLEDSLAVDRAKSTDITPELTERFVALSRYAKMAGATGVLYTCSAFGPAIEEARKIVDLPTLKPNEAMFGEALAIGGRIGLLATFQPAIGPMRDELEQMAAAMGKQVEIEARFVPDALDALQKRKDGDTHDRLIADAAGQFSGIDVLLLAQFSMARARAATASMVSIPVLSSPDSAVHAIRRAVTRT